jgi:hypothetical protein
MIQAVSWFVFNGSSMERVTAEQDEMGAQGQLE